MESPRKGQDTILDSPDLIPQDLNADLSQEQSSFPGRKSSVRFAEHNTTPRSSMSSRRRAPSSDEITPIRTAGEDTQRNYNTNDGVDERDAAVGTVAYSSSSPTEGAASGAGIDKKPSWYRRIAEKYGSVSLENKGSTARDHLALERTFLAWLRTSLAFASIGVAITQLFRLNTSIASRTQSISVANSQKSSELPLSPLLGQSIPIEMVSYLQQVGAAAAAGATASALPKLGPTLLDQLLLLPDSSNPSQIQLPIQSTAFDEDAAAKLRHVGKPLGATFLAISIVILFIGFHRYFESQHWIIRGKFPASRGSIFLVGFITGALILASLIVVLVIAPTTFEKK